MIFIKPNPEHQTELYKTLFNSRILPISVLSGKDNQPIFRINPILAYELDEKGLSYIVLTEAEALEILNPGAIELLNKFKALENCVPQAKLPPFGYVTLQFIIDDLYADHATQFIMEHNPLEINTRQLARLDITTGIEHQQILVSSQIKKKDANALIELMKDQTFLNMLQIKAYPSQTQTYKGNSAL